MSDIVDNHKCIIHNNTKKCGKDDLYITRFLHNNDIHIYTSHDLMDYLFELGLCQTEFNFPAVASTTRFLINNYLEANVKYDAVLPNGFKLVFT